jgi:hypothetical protein
MLDAIGCNNKLGTLELLKFSYALTSSLILCLCIG